MKKIIFMFSMLLLIPFSSVKNYRFLTVVRTYEKYSDSYWEIEYKGSVYLYSNINLPLDSKVVIADCSESIPYIITP